VRYLSTALLILASSSTAALGQNRVTLHDRWQIQSSAKVGTDGAVISSATYRPGDWYRATVPSTVVGTLVEDSVFKDPFFGMNLRSMPGMTYGIGKIARRSGFQRR